LSAREGELQRVRIVTDSTADLPQELADELGVRVIPCEVVFGDRAYRDRVDLSPTEFYQKLSASPTLPTTVHPPIGSFIECYRELLDEGAAILSLHISLTLSSVCNAARFAVEQFPDDSPIVVIDSRQLSMGLGLLVIELAQAATRGGDLPEMVNLASQVIPRLRVAAMLDNLEYVRRGGRISRTAALVGALLSLKPVFQVVNGQVSALQNARTRKRALRRLFEFVDGLGQPQSLAVMHATQPQLAWEVREQLAGSYPDRPVWFTEAGPAVGTHVGPGAIGVACLLG
jgi:DegV family protein with EDD domain